ncbi:NAD-dependent epimerase/dehydratase family protein [Microbacterium sp. SLBN-146]|uniref:NAD-dependent epimerase/dehydratase family protein n=1 Tax=Microbacterium sp. SLBN-146 TaxID=2768457 RepID=UPI00114D6A70|nr:NAD-dependent epimerase/dehydratase family protein [Microbacterium sp. SLBN-146]TQJ32448.1 nucleoside-diphosphate-sugar epimerase [Microbacterium sp. SLBN-146]
MTEVLILGGTGWLSGRVAQRWIDAGASVTSLARGSRPAPEGAVLVAADREDPSAYDAVRMREWDEVVDVSSRPPHVRSAVRALGDRAAHWTYISSVSVYAEADVVGADESAALAPPADTRESEEEYPRAKAACEAAVRAALEDRAAIVRPGLVVGPGDPTDRFGYWVGRFALAEDGPVLVPDAPHARAQVIDVDDLADFVVAMGRERWAGSVTAAGDSVPLVDVLRLAALVGGHTGDVVRADESWLTTQDVSPWAGPSSLPLWLPAELTGFATRSNALYRRLGGRLRPLHETLERVLADERDRGLDRSRGAGLTRAEERALLARLAATE